MPSLSTTDDIQQLTLIIFTILASHNTDLNLKVMTLRSLLLLIRGDKRIFDAFRPSESLLNKIKLGEMAMTRESSELSTLACDIISFMLRYNPQIDYVDFSNDAGFVRMIRRYEDVKYANELENLTLKIAEIERFATRGTGGAQVDDTYLEARIHDKVREAVEQSALGGEANLSKITAVEQSSIMAYY